MISRFKKIGAALIVALLLCVNINYIIAYAYNGIDVSSYQNVTDWKSVKNSNVKYVYVKATENTGYTNPKMLSQYNGAKSVNLHVGFYHFFNTSGSPYYQAVYFYNTIKNLNYDMKACLDVEIANRLTKEQISQRVMEFCETYKKLSGREIIVYSGSYFSRTYFTDSVLKEYKLWIAHYNVNNPVIPINSTCIGHQYTDHELISGVGYVDASKFTDDILENSTSNNKIDSSSVTYSTTTSTNSNVIVAKNYLRRDAKKIQYLLSSCGYSLSPDGVVGNYTATAIYNFQNSNNLTKDYMFGPQCKLAVYNKLKNILCGIKYITPQQTRYIQYRLGITVDGVYGRNTAYAVKQFQKKYGLVQDGIVGQNTWYYLIMY